MRETERVKLAILKSNISFWLWYLNYFFYVFRDPDDIKHVFNLDIYLDGKYIVGVHHGVVKGVKQYFLHNPFIFPTAYTDGDARYTMQQMAVMAKVYLSLSPVL